ncbi:MAG: arginine--tRNA ligase [Cyclobacteriaceae bacterium]
MSGIESQLKVALGNAFKAAFDHELSQEQLVFQPTRKDFEGTHTFVTFPYLKLTKKSPEETGKLLGENLIMNTSLIKSYNVVKGFLNLELSENVWLDLLDHVYNQQNIGQLPNNEQKVMVEFSSPNTNKPLHLGHLRNNFLGDSVSRILSAAGYEVFKTNLVNDRGIHICKSMLAYQKFGNEEAPGALKGDHLAGKYYVKFDQEFKKEVKELVSQGLSKEEAEKKAPLLLEAQSMLRKWEQKDPIVVALWEKMNEWVYDGFNQTYETMGISFDRMYKESVTYLLGKDIVDEGLEKGVFFKKEDGSVWIDLTDEGMDEKLLLRGDGTSVYMTQDMGTADYKYGDFPMDQSVYVVGNEQDYHFKVLFSIMRRLGRSYGKGLYHLSYGMVDLPSGKMKSREGTVVDADDLMQEMFDTAEQHTRELGKIEGLSEDEASSLYKTLGLGALKYFLLKVDPKKRMLFNPQESIEFQGHTGPFVQYTHARISAITRRAKEMGITSSVDKDLTGLQQRELDLISRIGGFDTAIQQAAKQYSPSIIAQYVYDLARDYNGFYQEISIFNEEDQSRLSFRIALSDTTARIIRTAMQMLGIEVPERM